MTGEIRVWHALSHVPEIRKGRILRPLAEMPTEQELVRDLALERARFATARATDRELARLCPIAERVGKVTYRTGARLARELPSIPEPPDNRLLNEYVRRRSFRKVPNNGRLKLTGKHAGALFIHPAALGE